MNSPSLYGPTNKAYYQIRLGKLLSLRPDEFQETLSNSTKEMTNLSKKISSLMMNNDAWSKLLRSAEGNELAADDAQDQFLENGVKEKLHIWLLHKVGNGGKGASVLDEKGQGVPHLAAALGYEWAIMPTVTAHVNINFRDVHGWTGLHWAAFCGREKMVAAFLALGAAPGALTEPTPEFPSRTTPAGLASASGYKGLAAFLSECELTIHLRSLEAKESNAEEISDLPGIVDDTESASLAGSIRNAIEAADRIVKALRAHSLKKKQAVQYDDDNGVISDERALSLSSSKPSKPGQLDTHAAATRIQKEFRGRRRSKEFPDVEQQIIKIQNVEIKSMTTNILEQIILDGSAEPKNLPLSFLQDITDNFSAERQIGRGGFGAVYKGVLHYRNVAVKKLFNSQTIEDEPFHRETNFLMNVKHQNIVRFLGFCAHTESTAIKVKGSGRYDKYIYPEMRERLLCFEYVSKGSLGSHLTDELRGLEWHARYAIIKGICQGLQYLHEEKGILHMDLKPANILLDDHMTPKIADFGISKYLDGISRAITGKCLMTPGYCAPEFLHRGEVSFKSDIYSLGVIIVDIVTGRKEHPDTKNVLRRWRYRWNKSAYRPPFGYQQVAKCIDIALRCVAESPKIRPYIWDIASELKKMESANEHISNDDESTADRISPYPWELLDLDPLELRFPFELNKQISCSLQLINQRDNFVAFSIHTVSPLQYCVEPNKNVLPPRSKCNVIVTLQAQKKAPQGMMCNNEFLVRTTIVNEGLTAENITQDMFDEKAGKVVDEVTLTSVIGHVAITQGTQGAP